ncbi:hypothetical protein M0R45_031026 [Rubus argutus]|uniref:Secreted protein n=1 Tax=Rubus argutus TaxID=59490 RepID=A0AAW1WCD6_RUBAR
MLRTHSLPRRRSAIIVLPSLCPAVSAVAAQPVMLASFSARARFSTSIMPPIPASQLSDYHDLQLTEKPPSTPLSLPAAANRRFQPVKSSSRHLHVDATICKPSSH